MELTFRAQLERLTAEQLHAGAPAIAIMLGLIEELKRVGVIAAAAREMDHDDLRKASAHLRESNDAIYRRAMKGGVFAPGHRAITPGQKKGS